MRSLKAEIFYYFVMPAVLVFLIFYFSIMAFFNFKFKQNVIARARKELPEIVSYIADHYEEPADDGGSPRGNGPRRMPNLPFGYVIKDASGRVIAQKPAVIDKKRFIRLNEEAEYDAKRDIYIDVYIRENRMFDELESMMSRSFRLFITLDVLMLTILFFYAAGKFSKRIIKANKKNVDELIRIANGDYEHEYKPQFTEFLPFKEGVENMATLLKNEDKRKNDFVTNLSHDMRTPVTIVRGMLEAVHDGVMKDDRKTYADIMEEVRRIEELLNKIGDFGRRRESPEKGSFPGGIVAHFQKRYARLMKIEADIPAGFEIPLREDELRTVLDNLLSNAYKYNRNEEKRCSVTCSLDEGRRVIKVRDNGIGIGCKELPFIFDKFYRGDSSRSGGNGSGVGLAITREIVIAAGGSINAASVPGEYTEFTITFGEV